MNGLADEADLRLRFDMLTKTKTPELHHYWATRDRAANMRLYRLAAEVLTAVEAGVFAPQIGWPCQDPPKGADAGRGARRLTFPTCPFPSDADLIPGGGEPTSPIARPRVAVSAHGEGEANEGDELPPGQGGPPNTACSRRVDSALGYGHAPTAPPQRPLTCRRSGC
jgi:hypothetical protein